MKDQASKKSKDDNGSAVTANEDTDKTKEDGGNSITMKFRNYRPHDAKLLKMKSSSNSSSKTEESLIDAVNVVGNDSQEKIVSIGIKRNRDPTDLIKEELAQHDGNELNIVPKKPNWDLKCQIEDKIQKLKRKTQKAIVEILREKLAETNDE